MESDQFENEQESSNSRNRRDDELFSKRLRAGRRRTYFFDVRTTKSNDYYLTITESKKRYNEDGYDRHKVFLYKEDFNKFVDALQETVDHIKTQLLPEYDFDEFSHSDDDDDYHSQRSSDQNYSENNQSSDHSDEETKPDSNEEQAEKQESEETMESTMNAAADSDDEDNITEPKPKGENPADKLSDQDEEALKWD